MSGPGRDGFRGSCSAPGLTLLPDPTLPHTTQPVQLQQCRWELQCGVGKLSQNIIAAHTETAYLRIAFLGACKLFPGPPSPRSRDVLTSRALQWPGQVSVNPPEQAVPGKQPNLEKNQDSGAVPRSFVPACPCQ